MNSVFDQVCPVCGKTLVMTRGVAGIWCWKCPDPSCKSNEDHYSVASTSGV